MFLEQQRFWLELVNARRHWVDEAALLRFVPRRAREFTDPPGWPVKRAYVFLVNNVDLIRANHRCVESGAPLDYDMLNHVLSEATLHLSNFGGVDAIQARQTARAAAGSRIETLVPVPRAAGRNPGTVFIKSAVQKAVYFFAQYVDYRFADPAYPDASPGKFQIKECLFTECRKLFIRTPETVFYCSDACARADR